MKKTSFDKNLIGGMVKVTDQEGSTKLLATKISENLYQVQLKNCGFTTGKTPLLDLYKV